MHRASYKGNTLITFHDSRLTYGNLKLFTVAYEFLIYCETMNYDTSLIPSAELFKVLKNGRVGAGHFFRFKNSGIHDFQVFGDGRFKFHLCKDIFL